MCRPILSDWSIRHAPIAVLLALCVASTCKADTFRWLNTGPDNNWGNSSNWEFGLIPPTAQPSGTTSNVFMRSSGSSDLADFFNNDDDWSIDSLTFETQATGSIDIIGGVLTLANVFSGATKSIVNSDGSLHSFSNERIDLRNSTVTFDADIGDLDFNTAVNFAQNSATLTVTGGNDVFFDGGITGSAFVTGGTMTVSGSGTIAHIASSATILSQINLTGGTLRIDTGGNLGNAVNISTFSGTTFDVNHQTQNVDQITGSGTITLGSGALTFGDSSNFTFSGSITGTGSLTKDQNGITTLSGVSSYSGATNITDGTLRLNNSTTDGSLSSSTDVNVSSGATFDLNGVTDTVDSVSGAGTILLGGGELIVDATSGTEIFSGNITESGTFRKLGNHALTLSGNNGFTSLILSGGTTSVSSSNNLGAASATMLLSSTLNVTNSFTNSRGVFLANGIFDIDTGDTLTQTGVIQNNTTTSSLTKTGSGILVLGGSNTYTGDTIVNNGRLEISTNERIGDSSDLVVNGGTFDLNNRTETVSGLGGTGGSIDTGGSSGRLIVNQSENLTYSGVISNAGGLTKQGTGTLTLNGNNTYDGTTVVQAGTLQLGASGGLDSTTDVAVSSGATFDLNGRSDTVDSISGAGTILLGGANLTVDQTSGTTTFSGPISESGAITKSGGHKLILSGNNSFTSGVLIFDGSVSVGADNNLGASSGDITLAVNGELETTGSFTTSRDIQFGMAANGTVNTATGTTLTHSGLLSGGTDVTLNKAGGGTYRLNAANAGFGGDIVVEAGTFEIGNFSGDALGDLTRITVNNGATLLNNQVEGFGSLAGLGSVVTNNTFEVGFDNSSTTYSGVISGNVGGGFVGKAGSGTMTITQPQTYTGQTRVNAGVLRLSVNGNLPNSSDVLVDGTWDLNNISDTIDALTGSGSVQLGTGALTVGSNNGSGTFSGVISETGSAVSGALVKVGSGIQTLTGNNTYTNQTVINGGTLRINTSANLGNGTVYIGNGARLQVQETTTNSRTVDLQPGGGVLDVANLKTLTQSGNLTGFAGLVKDGFGDLVVTGNNTYGGPTNIALGTMRLSGSGRLPNSTDVFVSPSGTWDLNGVQDTVTTISGAGNIQLGGGRLTVDGNDNSTYAFSGVISEPGQLYKDGDHTLVLSGINTFTGPIWMFGPTSGALSISSDANLGNASNSLNFDEGRLQTTASFTTPRAVTLTSNDGIIDVVGSQNLLEVSGIVSGTGRLFKEGTGRLYLNANNTYTGGTVVENGSVQIFSNAGLGANASPLTLATGRLVVTDEFTNLHPIILSGGGAIDTTNQAHFVNLPITGSGRLSKFGSGDLELNAGATHAGHTTVEEGTLWTGGGLPDLFDVELGDPSATWQVAIDDTIDALLGDGTVMLLGNTLTLGGGDGGDFFEGTLQGPGTLTKIGPGTQTLGGSNSHSATELNEGTLVVGSNANLGAAAAPLSFDDYAWLTTTSTFTLARDVTLNGVGGTFNVNGGTTLTVSNPISGPGGLRKRGLGTLILQGTNNFGGPMTVIEGLVQIETGMTFGGLSGNGNLDIGLNELTVNTTGDDTYGGVLSGIGGKLTKDGPGTLTLTGINTYTGGTCILDGVLRISQSENLGALGTLITFDGGTLNTTSGFSMIRGMSLNAGGGTIDVDAATLLDESGNITGVGSLTKTGAGTLQLSGFSTYAGGTAILDGEVSINNNINLGNTAGQLTLNNGSLHTSNNVSMARSTNLGSGGGAFRTDASTTLTHSGAISGNPATAGIAKRGAGNLRWQGNNTFTGDVFLEEGRLQIDATGQLGNALNILRMQGGTLNTLANLTNARTIHLEDGTTANTIEVATGTTLTQSGLITDGVAGPPETLAKAGGGNLVLTASNTYSSPTQVNAGTLTLSGGGQLPDVTDVSVSVGSTLNLNNVSDTIDGLSGSGDVTLGTATLTIGADDGGGSFNGVISGTGGLVKVGSGTQLLRTRDDGMNLIRNSHSGGTAIHGGVLNIEEDGNLGDSAGGLSFDSGTLQAVLGPVGAGVNSTRLVTLNAGGGTIDADDAITVTFGNVVSGAGSMTKEGLGSLVYQAANTYIGDTIINRGDLRLSAGGRIADSSNLIVNAPGEFNLNNVSDAVNGLSGNGSVLLGTGRLTVGMTGGNGNHSGLISGSGGITKAGVGTQILSGANTYSGATNLNGGVLQIALDTNLGNSSGTLLFDGGTLRTTGSFNIARSPTLNAGGGTIDTATGTTLNTVDPFSGVGNLTKLGQGTLRLTGVST